MDDHNRKCGVRSRYKEDEWKINLNQLKKACKCKKDDEMLGFYFISNRNADDTIFKEDSHGLKASDEHGLRLCVEPHKLKWEQFGVGEFCTVAGKAQWGEEWIKERERITGNGRRTSS